MKRFFLAALAGLLIGTLAFGADIESLIGTQDLNRDTDNATHGTFQRRTSTGGTITLDKIDGNQIPWSNAYTGHVRPHDITGHSVSPGNITGFDNLTLTGNIAGDNTGRVQGLTIGAAAGTDNGIFNNLSVSGTPTFTDNTINGADLIDNTVAVNKLNFTPAGYVLPVSSWSTLSIVDSQTLYWGAYGTLVSTTATNHKVYIPKSATIKRAHITVGCETVAGTGEAWPFYVRIDNATDTLIESVAEDNVAIRTWDNTAMSVAVTAGSYLEIKSVNPAWATNPIECYFGGYLYIE